MPMMPRRKLLEHKPAPTGQKAPKGQPPHDPWAGLPFALEAPLERIRAAVARSGRGVILQGAEVRALQDRSVAPTGTQLAGAGGRLQGWSLRETAAAPARLVLRNGRDSAADVVAIVSLSAGESNREFWPGGVSFTEALYADLVLGAVEGVVYIGAVD